MLKFFDRFRKKDEFPEMTEIELSKIDKHMNFILRDNLGYINRSIAEKINDISSKKEKIIHSLHELHKSRLSNTNIPGREMHIMDGNRDNYVKRVSHFISDVNVPKSYLDTYDYCIRFSRDLETLNKETQKNVFVLHNFFGNEVTKVNKEVHELEELIIDIRVMLEKNGIELLKDIQKDIKKFGDNLLKINDLKTQIEEERANIASHKDRLDKLSSRIKTITTGTDYRALEGFKKEKDEASEAMNRTIKDAAEQFSCLESTLKKYYYLNPDKKIVREYLGGNLRSALITDSDLAIQPALQSLKELIKSDQIDLKDAKKDKCITAIDRLSLDYLKWVQTDLRKLENTRQRAQTKITHNSASLNLSEQQYWINATEDKIKYHNTNIEKIEKNIGIIKIDNEEIHSKIKKDLQNLLSKEIKIIDDITGSVERKDGENQKPKDPS